MKVTFTLHFFFSLRWCRQLFRFFYVFHFFICFCFFFSIERVVIFCCSSYPPTQFQQLVERSQIFSQRYQKRLSHAFSSAFNLNRYFSLVFVFIFFLFFDRLKGNTLGSDGRAAKKETKEEIKKLVLHILIRSS